PIALNAIGDREAVVGTGNVSSSLVTPYKGNWTAAKSQFLYTAAELSALGFRAGSVISGLGFDITTFTGPTYTFENFTIALKHTTATSLSAWQTGMTTVVNSHSYTLSGAAPFSTMHAFDTPFV